MLFPHNYVACILLRFGHPRTSSSSSPRWFEVWGPSQLKYSDTLQYQALTHSIAPDHAQMYHFNTDALALHPSIYLHSLQPHVGELAFLTCSQQLHLSLLPFPFPLFAPLAIPGTLTESPSPVKGVLTPTSEQALFSMYRAQARAKQYQLNEARLNLRSRALQGMALCWGRGG